MHIEWLYEGRKFRLVDTAGLLRIGINRKLLHSKREKRVHKMQSLVGRYDLSLPGTQVG